MSLLARAKCLLMSAIRRKRVEQEMDDEMKFHVASYTDDLIRSGSGVGPGEFGGVAGIAQV